MLADCCIAGEQLAEKGGQCAEFKPSSNVSAELLSSCFFSSDICCSAKLRIEQCKLGVLAGKEGLDCYGNPSAFYASCCESCKIGLVIGATHEDCVLNTIEYGAPFDESYMFCCQEMKMSVIQTEEENGGLPKYSLCIYTLFFVCFYFDKGDACSSIDPPCSQICENKFDSYVCKCEAGFRLLGDKRTCVADDSTGISNEVNGTVS